MNAAMQQRIGIAAASIVLIVAIVVLAVRAGDDEDTVASPSPTASAERTTKPAATQTPAAKTTAPGSRTEAPATAAATAAPDDNVKPGPAVPPKPGTYRYRVTQNDQRTDSTLRISSLGSMRWREAS